LSTFEYVSVAFSFVIGLSVTYLLGSLLSLFRERRICSPDWLPLSSLRTLVVCHCYREAESVIRLISARKATKSERGEYEQRWSQ
jgi:hypothetical protein